MSVRPADATAAFSRLQRALLRRRLAAIDPRLRLELAAIGALIAGFVFWQMRLRLAALAANPAAGGPLAVTLDALGALALLATIGGALAGGHHAARLQGDARGPLWLALPVPPRIIERHLAWASRLHALWMTVPAIGVLVAPAGLVPAWWLPLLAVAFAGMLLGAGCLGCAVARGLALLAAEPRPGLHPIARVLATAARRSRAVTVRPARWRHRPAWLALMRKDLLVTSRPGPARARLVSPIAFGALSLAAWALPEAPQARLAAFVLALLCAASWAAWLVAITGSDPFAIIRGLPLGLGGVWGARVGWAFLAALALVAGHAPAARSLDAPALRLFLAWTGAATFGIGLLGANYGATLYPRTDHAQRILALSLGIAVAASVMLPLLGWVVLATAIVHSLRRLPRWHRLEAD